MSPEVNLALATFLWHAIQAIGIGLIGFGLWSAWDACKAYRGWRRQAGRER